MSIYIITHKSFESFTNSKAYKTLLVGAVKNEGRSNYLRDDDFPNHISEKNPHFCELTGAYWIWKKSQESIVGLVHYRRFFEGEAGKSLEIDEVRKHLATYDVILPKKQKVTSFKIPCGMKKHFATVQGLEGQQSWEVMERVLKTKYPEMSEAFNRFEKQKSGYFYNMCIMKKETFAAYHEWLFDILFQVEKELDISSFSPYNQRMFGFLSERLMTFWVEYHQLAVKELPVVFTEKRSLMSEIKQLIARKLENNG